jgi:hypothetical protein
MSFSVPDTYHCERSAVSPADASHTSIELGNKSMDWTLELPIVIVLVVDVFLHWK